MSPVRLYTPTEHDFFDELVALFVNLGSFNAATESFWSSSSTKIPESPNHTINLYGHTAHVSFPIYSLMHEVVRNVWPDSLQLRIHPASTVLGSFQNPIELQSAGIEKMITQLVGATFLKYYERNASRPKIAYPGGPKAWPELWRFAWLLRNAIAHGDKWKIDDQTFPATVWNGVSVSPNDANQPWYNISKYIGGGDLILLMEQLNANTPQPARGEA
jgi:hypothetical protein